MRQIILNQWFSNFKRISIKAFFETTIHNVKPWIQSFRKKLTKLNFLGTFGGKGVLKSFQTIKRINVQLLLLVVSYSGGECLIHQVLISIFFQHFFQVKIHLNFVPWIRIKRKFILDDLWNFFRIQIKF